MTPAARAFWRGLVWVLCPSGLLCQEPGAKGFRAFAEASDSIRELLVQFDPEMVYEVYPTLRDLARSLDQKVRIVVAVPREESRGAAKALLGSAGFAESRVRLVPCGQELSIWARDRILPFRSGAARGFFHPIPGALPEDRNGDLAVARRLAGESGCELRTGLRLEGGNVVAGGGRVFVGSSVYRDNPRMDRGAVQEALRGLLGVAPVVLGRSRGVPHDHVDMYLSIVGKDAVLLGDPHAGGVLLQKLVRDGLRGITDAEQGDFHPARQRAMVPVYEAIRAELVRLGVRVERVPILHSDTGTILTWNNALLEWRDGRRHAYVPNYGLPGFDAAAVACYRKLGFQVHAIDVARLASFGGTVRCLTNVIDWERPERERAGEPPRDAGASPGSRIRRGR